LTAPSRPRPPSRPTLAAVIGRATIVTSLLVAAPLLGGCSFFAATPQARGNRVDADVLKELVPGTSTRADATALIGSPTTHATFDDNIWIYIGSITQPLIGRTQEVVSQDVVVLTFNEAGVLQNVKRLNQDDALPVDVVARATPSPGSEASIMQQLFGSVGRFSPVSSGAKASENSNTQ
jgi:outer membrane protein assembly factor BamE (lipoprotein component of BamABCDE complex)